jgi:hypothetical protein
MRKLTQEEQKTVQTMIDRGKLSEDWNPAEMKVEYFSHFPFAMAKVSQGKLVRLGFSKYNYGDRKLGLKYKPEVGERVAFSKALRG